MASYIIAEAGVNHNGSPDMALSLVNKAAEAGADAVKFQSFRAENLASKNAPKADYQARSTGSGESQVDMLRLLELNEDAHRQLVARCREKGIEFLSSPFDQPSVDLLVRLGISKLKLGSGELTNGPLLLHCAKTGKPILLSTGMSTLAEIEQALGVLAFGYVGTGEPSLGSFAEAYSSESGQAALRAKVTLLHCTTEYPAPFEEVNLRAIDTLATAFGLPVGYSDHTEGISIAVAAAARGAAVIEKHFTLDRRLPGPDHQASLEPSELQAMVRSIRQVESALGSGAKVPSPSERKNMAIARKSLVSSRSIAAGQPFTVDNLTAKRPGTGVSPMKYWEWLGQAAHRDYHPDEQVSE